MAIAAVPAYLGTDFSSASPGMRFGACLKLWDNDYRKEKSSAAALNEAVRLTLQDRQLMAALVERQTMLAERLQPSGQLLRIDAEAIAPFTTGLGNEHPLENGFAFLNPYGLPYLCGSGVKGVLRQAARELASGAWGEAHGWDQDERFTLVLDKGRAPMTMLDLLFGKESIDGDREHVRGALRFWDVFPQVPGSQLAVEVMTAHQSHYLQDNDTPHESGQLYPINFLTVPPGAGFHFHIQCDQPFLARLAPELATPEVWQSLLSSALEHAFDWLGFGAKTAVGYGAMRRDKTAEQARLNEQRAAEEQRQREEEERQRREEAMARAAQQQAAFDALPESEKALRRFEEGMTQFASDGPLNKDQYPEFSRLVNALAEQSITWADDSERQRAVEVITAALDRFGWSAPGVRSERRKKQEKKRRQLIEAVIKGDA